MDAGGRLQVQGNRAEADATEPNKARRISDPRTYSLYLATRRIELPEAIALAQRS